MFTRRKLHNPSACECAYLTILTLSHQTTRKKPAEPKWQPLAIEQGLEK